NAIIGIGAGISAHLWMTSPSGKRIYITAPVKIGKRVFVGGGALVMLGCTIGEDAVVQPCSYLPPHTEVPPGEIWGGNPASFQRKRPQKSDGVSEGPATHRREAIPDR